MDFLVEADIDAALQQTGEDAGTRQAVRRQADRIFEPFMSRVWVPAGGGRAAHSPDVLGWPEPPDATAPRERTPQPPPDGPRPRLFSGSRKVTERRGSR